MDLCTLLSSYLYFAHLGPNWSCAYWLCLPFHNQTWRVLLKWAETWVEGVKGCHHVSLSLHSSCRSLNSSGFLLYGGTHPTAEVMLPNVQNLQVFCAVKAVMMGWQGSAFLASELSVPACNSCLHVLTVSGSSGAVFPHISSYFFIQNVWKLSFWQTESTDPLGLCEVLKIWEQTILNPNYQDS